jgi:hypothetical protein
MNLKSLTDTEFPIVSYRIVSYRIVGTDEGWQPSVADHLATSITTARNRPSCQKGGTTPQAPHIKPHEET